MSARINGIANTKNDISVENNIIKLPLVRTGNINLFAGSTNNADFTSVNSNIVPDSTNNRTLGTIEKQWSNAYIRDLSISSIDVSVNLNPLIPNKGTIGLSNKPWGNAYINDVSVINIDISGNLNPITNNGGSLGLANKIWRNAYIRDLSVTNIEVSGNIILNISGGGSIININRLSADISNNKITTTTRLYQEISGDISWNAVNGYYGLAKDAYPALDPYSRAANTIYNLNPITGIENTSWNSICWSPELSLFVAVAFNARVMTSSNGITWTTPITTPITSIRYVCWSPERKLFLAVSDGGSPDRAMTSIDGITWIPKTPALNAWRIVCWSGQLGIFVAIATGGTSAAYSTDGTTWVPTSVENNEWRGLCWSAELRLFLAIAQAGTTSNKVMTSSNGINWIPRTIEVCYWQSVCWSPQLGIFLAVGTGGASLPNGTFKNVAISSNGISWSYIGVTLQDWFNVCWSPQLRLFLAIGNSRSMSSPDGIIWTSITTSQSFMRGICWSPELGIFATTADSGATKLMISSLKARPPTSYNVFDSSFNSIDETGKWTFANIDINTNLNPITNNTGSLGAPLRSWGNAYIRDLSVTNISVSGNIILNISGGGSIININKISADISNNKITTTSRLYQEISGDISWNAVNGYYGLAKDAYPALNPLSSGLKAVQTWTIRQIPTPGIWTCICWSPKVRLFVTLSESLTEAMVSNNGINWTSTPIQAASYTSIIWCEELEIFVAVAYSATRVITSRDGTTWDYSATGAPSGQGNWWFSICWSPQLRLFVAVAGNGTDRVMTSKDGKSWNASKAAQNNYWSSVCWSPELGLFVAVANSGPGVNRVMTSKNGTDWALSVVTLNAWISVCWSAQVGIFVAVSTDGADRVMISQNGTFWTDINVLQYSWYSVCWSAELKLFVAVASNSGNRIFSSNGVNWTSVNIVPARSICWSPELGIFATIGQSGSVQTSSLKGRPPTSYNVFDSSFNSIDEFGKWTFTNIDISTNLNPLIPNSGSIGLDNKRWGVINTVALNVNGVSVTSDDRLKHNEVIINNGLTVISQLTPKFYQKTLEMLDAHYYGDLTGYTWNYESGLIAQELLQIKDLSFVVTGGDYYDSNNTLLENQYSVNYNSVFVYGLAAIKELDVKVKNQESIINSLLTRIEALENKP